MFMFKTGQLVRSKSGRLFRVVGCLHNSGRWTLQELRSRWTLQELRKGRVYTAVNGAASNFTLIGNNYKAKR